MTINLPVYYINLDSSVDRRASMEVQLQAVGITNPERVSAFDGRKVDLTQVSDCDLQTAQRFLGRPLRGGEYGCYKSHLECLDRFLATDSPYAMILEDDIQFDENLFSIAQETIRFFEDSGTPWDAVHLAPGRLKIFEALGQLSHGRDLVQAYYFPQVTGALLWSRQGAENIRDNHSVVTMPVDSQFRETMTKRASGFAVWPTLISYIGADSDIDGDAGGRKVNDRSWYYGLAKQRRLWRNKITARIHKLKG